MEYVKRKREELLDLLEEPEVIKMIVLRTTLIVIGISFVQYLIFMEFVISSQKLFQYWILTFPVTYLLCGIDVITLSRNQHVRMEREGVIDEYKYDIVTRNIIIASAIVLLIVIRM